MSISGVRIRNENGKEVYSTKDVGAVINFGRDKKVCHVAFDPLAARVSRVHATIEWTDKGLTFFDKSKEGTLVNGKRVKQSKVPLEEGVYQLEVGGIFMSIVVDGFELDETVVGSLSPTSDYNQNTTIETRDDRSIVKDPTLNKEKPIVTENSDDEYGSTTVFRSRDYSRILKRKKKENSSEEPPGKRGPKFDFDMEMSRVITRGPTVRKASHSHFDDETPAKKIKQMAQNSSPSGSATERIKPEDKNDIESIVTQVAALSSVSQESEDLEENNHAEQHFDRGPAAPNETIKYANLIFHPTEVLKDEKTFIDPRVPNFKRFVPKNMRNNGRTSVASNYSYRSSNITIPMIDSRIVD